MKRSDLEKLRALVARKGQAADESTMSWNDGVLVWDRRGPLGAIRYESRDGKWRPLTWRAVAEFEHQHGACRELRQMLRREEAMVS